MADLKYKQIKEYLLEAVLQPESAVQMPTIRELMSRFNVSLATVNHALSELEHEGIIVRRQGAGIRAAGNLQAAKMVHAEIPSAVGNILFVQNNYPCEMAWKIEHTINQYARQSHCNLVEYRLYPETDTRSLIDFIKSQPNPLGVILSVGADRLDYERLEALGHLPMKVVLLNHLYFYKNCLPDNMYIVTLDSVDGAKKCIDFLLSQGHRNIGFIRNEPRSEFTDPYQKTLSAELQRRGIEFGNDHIFSTTIRSWENSLDAAVQLTEENIDKIREKKFTALIFKSAIGGVAAMKPLQKAGFRIPEDISLIGEADLQFFKYLSPAPTVVTADYSKMSCTAIDILLGKTIPENQIVLMPQKLIERESVCPMKCS